MLIEKLRKSRGISRAKLAEMLGVTRFTVRNWEIGKTTPRAQELKAMSKIFNTSCDELIK